MLCTNETVFVHVLGDCNTHSQVAYFFLQAIVSVAGEC